MNLRRIYLRRILRGKVIIIHYDFPHVGRRYQDDMYLTWMYNRYSDYVLDSNDTTANEFYFNNEQDFNISFFGKLFDFKKAYAVI